jgi:hypothetical protein
MTRRLTCLCVALAAVGAAGVTCAARSGAAVQPVQLHAALRSSVPFRAGADLLAGNTMAIVRLEPSAPATIASVPAGHLLDPFRAALKAPARPATSPAVTLLLPFPPPEGLTGVAFEIVFFTDLNHDAAWQRGEPYATAWSGGRGGYRVTLPASSPSTGPAWRLLEGGQPPTVHLDPADVVVYIDPVRRAVER